MRRGHDSERGRRWSSELGPGSRTRGGCRKERGRGENEKSAEEGLKSAVAQRVRSEGVRMDSGDGHDVAQLLLAPASADSDRRGRVQDAARGP
eukprot:1278053-Rhodomonas_salina.1